MKNINNITDNSKIIAEAFKELLSCHDSVTDLKESIMRLYMDFNDAINSSDVYGNSFGEHFFLLHNIYTMVDSIEKHTRE